MQKPGGHYKLLKFKKKLKWIIDSFSDELFILVNKSKGPVGGGVICPVCQIHLKQFKFSDKFNSYCPKCKSLSRHRGFALVYQHYLGKTFPHGQKKYLHFAAEKCLLQMYVNDGVDYVTADFQSRSQKGSHFQDGRDISADMSNMPQIQNDSFDVVIAFDVLEHIKDDLKAISEVNRILRRGGVFCFSVPIQRLHTYEFNEGENQGDTDHVRSCGFDYKNRLIDSGFVVEVVSLIEESELNKLHDLKSSEHHPEIYICTKI